MIEIYIVDDHSIVTEGLVTMLLSETGIRIAGFGSDAESCMDFLKRKKIDVVLCDISLPGVSGIELCKFISTHYPNIKVLGLSTYNQGRIINDMMENGAMGYLLKNANKQEIVEALQTVVKGKKYIGFEANKIYNSYISWQNNLPKLTKREVEILKLITDGYTNLEISKQLFISVDTVDTHRKNLYLKTGVNNTASLIRYATLNELI